MSFSRFMVVLAAAFAAAALCLDRALIPAVVAFVSALSLDVVQVMLAMDRAATHARLEAQRAEEAKREPFAALSKRLEDHAGNVEKLHRDFKTHLANHR